MKHLVMPGLPLLAITTTLHDPNNIVSVMLMLALTGAFVFGSVFIVLYALAAFVLRILNPKP